SGSISVTASAASICSGDAVIFSGTALNGTAGIAGWPVTMEGALSGSNTTGAAGYYAFSGSVTGTGTATATAKMAYTSISGSINVSFITCTTATATPIPTISSTPTPVPSVTVTPQATATATPIPSAGVFSRDLDGSSSVTATLSSSSSNFSLKFTANSTGFNGTLEYELPFDYADYSSGSLSLSPAPASTRNGSVIASWKVSLKPGEEFTVGVHFSKAALPSILEQFAPPTTKPETASGTPTPTPAPNSLGSNFGGFVKSQGLNIVLILTACGILLGGIMFYSKLKSKQVSPASAQKSVEAKPGQSVSPPQPSTASPENKPSTGLNIDFSIWKKKDEKKP
ncbi:MAG: hypothetical protein V1708_05085, partial [Candidatus Micrarchaeota archaeon]